VILQLTLTFDDVPDKLRDRQTEKELAKALQSDRETMLWLLERSFIVKAEYLPDAPKS
jgi:hypothetical protein